MAKIGLDEMHYATFTEDPGTKNETYETPEQMTGAANVKLDITPIDASFSADNKKYFRNVGFGEGKITVILAEILSAVRAKLFDAKIDTKGGVVSYAESRPVTVALGFRAKKASGKYRYYWLYRVTFAPPSEEAKSSDGASIEYSVPTVEGSFEPRNKPDADGNHPYMYYMDEDDPTADASTISTWFETVKEPIFGA